LLASRIASNPPVDHFAADERRRANLVSQPQKADLVGDRLLKRQRLDRALDRLAGHDVVFARLGELGGDRFGGHAAQVRPPVRIANLELHDRPRGQRLELGFGPRSHDELERRQQ
jgi:hypothetical protein